jgi:hypothetical protein
MLAVNATSKWKKLTGALLRESMVLSWGTYVPMD